MKGRHDTNLVYVHEGGEHAAGIVTCVPRKGEIVELRTDGGRAAYRVEQVTWIVGEDPRDMYAPSPCTVARVSLSRCA